MWAQLDNVTNYLKRPMGSHMVRLYHSTRHGSPIYLAKIDRENSAMLLLQGENLYPSVRKYLNTMRIPHSVVSLYREKL